MMKRIIPRLRANSRETLKKNQLNSIGQSISMVIRVLSPYCKEDLVITPLAEVLNLITLLVDDDTFVETDAETKSLIVNRMDSAYYQLCLFAGKFYMSNEFEFTYTKFDILQEIVDSCIQSGFYFGYDKILREEGAI